MGGDTPDDFNLDGDETAANAADSIMESAPVADEALIATSAPADNPEAIPQSPAPSEDTDAAGERWDAAKHSSNKEKTSKGLWRKRRGVSSGSRVNKPDTALVDQAKERQAAEARARAAGITAAHSIFLLGTAFGGEEWKPREQPISERAMMEEAWSNYFVAKGVTDFPPGVALCMALCMYAAPRFTMPQTQERARGIKQWIALRIARRKLKKELKKRGIVAEVEIRDGVIFLDGREYRGTLSNRGDERERENDSRKA